MSVVTSNKLKIERYIYFTLCFNNFRLKWNPRV